MEWRTTASDPLVSWGGAPFSTLSTPSASRSSGPWHLRHQAWSPTFQTKFTPMLRSLTKEPQTSLAITHFAAVNRTLLCELLASRSPLLDDAYICFNYAYLTKSSNGTDVVRRLQACLTFIVAAACNHIASKRRASAAAAAESCL